MIASRLLDFNFRGQVLCEAKVPLLILRRPLIIAPLTPKSSAASNRNINRVAGVTRCSDLGRVNATVGNAYGLSTKIGIIRAIK